jgi:hypothetical protein
MKLKRRNDPAVRAFWSRHVALWMRSPFSQREYCERNGISRSLLSKWWIWLREDRAREERIKIGRCRGRSRRSTDARRITRHVYEFAREIARELAKTRAYELSRRARKKVEMLFAHLKRILQLNRLRLRGPAGAQFEFTFAAIAQNLRRLAKLTSRGPPEEGASVALVA